MWSHKARIALFLSAMRHFRDSLRKKGMSIAYRELDDRNNRGSLSAELESAVRSMKPRKLIVVEPGEIKHDSNGVRVYVEVTSIDTEGGLFNQVKEGVAGRAGKAAADGLQAAVSFKITDIRPLIDTMT